MSDKSEKRFSGTIQCRHCLNEAPMEIVASYSQQIDQIEIFANNFEDVNRINEMLKCPACRKLTIREYQWFDFYDDQDTYIEIIYPSLQKDDLPLGLPDHIYKALDAAQKVKSIDANAYAVLIGRVLEMVCLDRKAKGRNLADQLKDLAEKNEIPNKLVMVANKLRILRNIGAHAVLGDLTTEEVPILNSLSNAVLQYVYTAPFLASEAEKRVAKLKNKKSS